MPLLPFLQMVLLEKLFRCIRILKFFSAMIVLLMLCFVLQGLNDDTVAFQSSISDRLGMFVRNVTTAAAAIIICKVVCACGGWSGGGHIHFAMEVWLPHGPARLLLQLAYSHRQLQMMARNHWLCSVGSRLGAYPCHYCNHACTYGRFGFHQRCYKTTAGENTNPRKLKCHLAGGGPLARCLVISSKAGAGHDQQCFCKQHRPTSTDLYQVSWA